MQKSYPQIQISKPIIEINKKHVRASQKLFKSGINNRASEIFSNQKNMAKSKIAKIRKELHIGDQSSKNGLYLKKVSSMKMPKQTIQLKKEKTKENLIQEETKETYESQEW